MTNTTAAPVAMICPHCGSDEITKDATAVWCPETQAWIFGGAQDCETCQACGAEGDYMATRAPIAPAPQSGDTTPTNRELAATVRAALGLALERLEINDHQGDETEAMEALQNAQTAFDALAAQVAFA